MKTQTFSSIFSSAAMAMNFDGLSATSMKKFNLTEVMNRAQFDRFNSNVLRRKVLIKVFADGGQARMSYLPKYLPEVPERS